MNALRLAAILAAFAAVPAASAQTAAVLGRPAGPTRAVDPKVPQPGQQDKIFPLNSSWVAVSLNGKAFRRRTPDVLARRPASRPRLRRLQQLLGHDLSAPRTRHGGRAVRAHQEGVRQGRDGLRAGLSRGAAYGGEMGHQRPHTHHQDPERRVEIRTLALMALHRQHLIQQGEADHRFALFTASRTSPQQARASPPARTSPPPLLHPDAAIVEGC